MTAESPKILCIAGVGPRQTGSLCSKIHIDFSLLNPPFLTSPYSFLVRPELSTDIRNMIHDHGQKCCICFAFRWLLWSRYQTNCTRVRVPSSLLAINKHGPLVDLRGERRLSLWQ